ncbi:MAG: hypothetical protein ABIJ31_05790 [Pseudomonadota bacterium]
MKITDPDVIKNGEKDLIEAIKQDLDLDAVKEILKDQIARTVLSAKGGQIIVHNNQIAFRLDFDLNLSGSLMFDRDGNHILQSDEPDHILPDHILPEDLELDEINIADVVEEIGPDPDLLEEDLPDLVDGELDDDLDMNDILQESQEFWEPKQEP